MINKQLKSKRDVKIKDMSLADIDHCKDMLQVSFKDGAPSGVSGLNAQKSQWIRKGLGGGNFKNWTNIDPHKDTPDHVIKQLNDEEREELVKLIQEAQSMGEEMPSTSNSMSS
tara:strand:- start:33265 stop:33603 length:339 start_codon:yes stop_codon:yes gene_type:complete